MLTQIKHVVQAHTPGVYRVFQAAWRRFVIAPRLRHLERISAKIADRYGLQVVAGPFQGMRYLPEAFCSGHAPKLIGSYEAELHASLKQVLARDYTTIVDIGCAEGYYAVGLARHYPRCTVYAYDSELQAQQLCREMAALNGVAERVVVRGACDRTELARLPLAGTLLICDCEGCELDLLEPTAVPGLRDCDLIVELHDCFDPEISPTVLSRFAPTHTINLISSHPRNPVNYPAVHFLPALQQRLAVEDGRAFPVQWAVMLRKSENKLL